MIKKRVTFLRFLWQTLSIDEQQYKALSALFDDENDDRCAMLLQDREILPSVDVERLRAQFMNFPQTDLSDQSLLVTSILPEYIVNRHRVLVLREQNDGLSVAFSNPMSIEAIDAVSVYFRKKITIFLVDKITLDQKISFLYRPIEHANRFSTLSVDQLHQYEASSLLKNLSQQDTQDSHTAKLLNAFLEDADRMNASDIHIEAQDEKILFRYRLYGTLLKQTSISSDIKDILIRHILSRSDGDISELYMPQDTAFSYKAKAGHTVNIRVSTVYSINGYSIVMRLLKIQALQPLSSYIVNEALRHAINTFIDQRNGMFIVAGPTGSGKTSMLYHILQHMAQSSHAQKKIMTIEDPVEVILPGMTQVQVNPRIGLDFDDIMKVSLRQNPDVLMLGEIRDAKSAMIAMRASITGVMVFATIHARTPEEAIFRFKDLGVSVSVMANTLKLVVSTRLLRKLCSVCKTLILESIKHAWLQEHAPAVNLDHHGVYSAVGCSACHFTGHMGFLPIYEFFSMTEAQHDALSTNNLVGFRQSLSDQIRENTLFNQAFQLCQQGLTSFEEISSVIFMAR